MIMNSTSSDIRYLELYNKQHDKRQANWLKSNPPDLHNQNLKRLKQLIALNFTKRRKSNQVNCDLSFPTPYEIEKKDFSIPDFEKQTIDH